MALKLKKFHKQKAKYTQFSNCLNFQYIKICGGRDHSFMCDM